MVTREVLTLEKLKLGSQVDFAAAPPWCMGHGRNKKLQEGGYSVYVASATPRGNRLGKKESIT
ncbi:hypothetical protein FIBSPDRAFT_392569 [Athelia psychrophila]|uniref:Uncharacterized protein n=1 Tax=Athelia psychrophila TaxID=1759441 RepID=A0A167V411_9AGAM|nr:hypothetical protein FIBSPDRAFT_392569 [Fibularhizoctonia sp. CBS 109695]